jgi:hypothetical protein
MIRSIYDRRPLLASAVIAMTISAGIFWTPMPADHIPGGCKEGATATVTKRIAGAPDRRSVDVCCLDSK